MVLAHRTEIEPGSFIPCDVIKLLIRTLSWLLQAIRVVMATFVIMLFVYMTAAVFTEVIGRYVFNFSIAGAEESATFALIWMVLFGAGVAMRRNQHVGIDILVVQCPVAVQRIVVVVATALALWFLWIVFKGSFALIEVGRLQRSAAMQWPMNLVYTALPVGATYFALELLLAAFSRLFGAQQGAAGRQLADEL
jgi:TRAP-type C4-dicarboxylate transport system, small permease component